MSKRPPKPGDKELLRHALRLAFDHRAAPPQPDFEALTEKIK